VVCLLALTSTAVWVQAAIALAQTNDHVATTTWAIIVGVVSFIICAFYLLMEHSQSNRGSFAMLLAGWWMQGVAFSFVPTPFLYTLNGFLATWSSVALAVYLARTDEFSRDMLPIPTADADDDGHGGPTTAYQMAADATEGFSSSFDLDRVRMGGSASWVAEAVTGAPEILHPPQFHTPNTPPPEEVTTFRHTGSDADA
jgi:hypothetical protein